MSGRVRLPARRPAVSEHIAGGGVEAHATVRYDDAGRPKEIFLAAAGAGRGGSAVDSVLRDAATAVSIALQHGVSARDLADSALRLADGRTPASIVGAALDLLAREEGA